jgi:hypothetical protein
MLCDAANTAAQTAFEFGVSGVFAFVALCMLIVITAVATLGPRTRRLEVEAIAL